ncbi:MAG: NADH-quinone oxidoreductase subunit N [Planctomycetes bacterium]|nr:NADH-quinone oxidoreductase subunit N [Planctomycetota bacterium]
MNLHDVISQLIIDSKSSIGMFLPELVICVTIVLMLLVRVFNWGRRIDAFVFALGGSVVAFILAAATAPIFKERMEIFTGMLVYDTFAIYMRSVLLLFVVLFVILTRLSGIPDREDGPDIYTLVLGATLGMCLMVSANHLMMVFMAVEMASVPCYALAGLMKGRRQASEAALKYAVYGAGAAGVMLYGISLIAGITNSAHLPTIAAELATRLPHMLGDEKMVLALGGLMMMVGLAFKLSAVPFHFWCPDVFEGATAEVDAFLSVASKAAALALLVRVAIGIGVEVEGGLQAGTETTPVAAVEAAASEDSSTGAYFAVEDSLETRHPNDDNASAQPPANEQQSAKSGSALEPVQSFIAKLIALLAVITCTFGNLTAYGQTNLKRLLAYSTIAHAGYMMMAIPPMMAMAQANPALAEKAAAALAIYIAVYLFMNLGAFAVVAFLRNAMRSEEIADCGGLIRRCPGIVICFSMILFALVGLPPLSGFIGKFAIFASLVEGYQQTDQFYLLVLLIVGGVNTAISLFYYLRVVKVMTMEPEPDSRGPFSLPLVSLQGMYLFAITVPTLVLITCWDFLNEFALNAARQLLG